MDQPQQAIRPTRRSLLAAGATGGLALAAPRIARGATPRVLRFAHYVTVDHPANIAAEQFAHRVETRTHGALKIAIFPNGQLGDPPQETAELRSGAIDMSVPTEGELDKYVKAFAAVPLPFIFPNRDLAFKVLDGPAMAWLAPQAAQQGFITLRNWDYGFRHITTAARAIHTPADVKGLKIRTPPAIQIEAAMQALGAIVSPISFSELYLALAQHTVDGEENPIPVIYLGKYYEVQKYLALTYHVYTNMIHTVSARTWASLSPGEQQIMREESTSAGNLMRKLIAGQEQQQLAALKQHGMAVTTPDLEPFRAKMKPAWKQVAAYAGEGNVRNFVAMVKKAEA